MPTAREFLASAKGIVALVFSILGAVFGLVGAFVVVGGMGAEVAGAPRGIGAGVGAGGAVFLVVGAAIGAVGVGLGVWRLAALRAKVRLRQIGMVCQAIVVDVRENMHVRVNRRHPWVVRYRYTAGGREHEGAETMMDLPPGLRQGEHVDVVYDPVDTAQSAIKTPI